MYFKYVFEILIFEILYNSGSRTPGPPLATHMFARVANFWKLKR